MFFFWENKNRPRTHFEDFLARKDAPKSDPQNTHSQNKQHTEMFASYFKMSDHFCFVKVRLNFYIFILRDSSHDKVKVNPLRKSRFSPNFFFLKLFCSLNIISLRHHPTTLDAFCPDTRVFYYSRFQNILFII